MLEGVFGRNVDSGWDSHAAAGAVVILSVSGDLLTSGLGQATPEPGPWLASGWGLIGAADIAVGLNYPLVVLVLA